MYGRGLAPFNTPSGSAYVSADTFTTTAFSYVYDTLPTAVCADAASTGFTMGGGPATCAQLSSYCNGPSHGASVQRVCRQTCAQRPQKIPRVHTIKTHTLLGGLLATLA